MWPHRIFLTMSCSKAKTRCKLCCWNGIPAFILCHFWSQTMRIELFILCITWHTLWSLARRSCHLDFEKHPGPNAVNHPCLTRSSQLISPISTEARIPDSTYGKLQGTSTIPEELTFRSPEMSTLQTIRLNCKSWMHQGLLIQTSSSSSEWKWTTSLSTFMLWISRLRMINSKNNW